MWSFLINNSVCYSKTRHILFFKGFKSLRFFSTNNETSSSSELNLGLLPGYKPKEVESQRYEWWESKNYFKPTKSELESYVVLLPPPNITGSLHLGHALTCILQDVILRWKKMKGESVLWVPGIDHAGIATQVAVEKHISHTLGCSKHTLGKDEFLKIAQEWKESKELKIKEQLRSLGATLDWTKLAYTMDDRHSQLVKKYFIQLFDEGLIYRKNSLVNWSCALKSSISDIEVDWVEIQGGTKFNVPGYEKPVELGILYDIAYKICDEDGEIVVSTSRPELMLGDMALIVNDDLKKFSGKKVWHPFREEKIPVYFEKSLPLEGVNAVNVTPSHSLNDFAMGLRYDLNPINVIDESGNILEVGKNTAFHGLKRFEATRMVIEELHKLGLFRGKKSHSMTLPVCSRSGDIIEYIQKSQWFLSCESLAEKAVDAVRNGRLQLLPSSYNKVWYDWLANKPQMDWNLSRQLWWGHQIPVYSCTSPSDESKNIWVAASSLEEAKRKASQKLGVPEEDLEISQDTDVLDTWFSSALLPLNPVIDQERRPPISLMVTGHDILFFWVARMVMLSLHLTGELPFNQVLLHSLICDADGRKMSKSLGNVISPEDIINGCTAAEMEEKLKNQLQRDRIDQKNIAKALATQKKMFPNGIPECGVDGLRFTLCLHYIQEAFFNFDINLCRSSKLTCNKITQATNYLILKTNEYKKNYGVLDLADIRSLKENFNYFDKWILSRQSEVITLVNESLSCYEFCKAAIAIRLLLIEDFCSLYLESLKEDFQEKELQRTNLSVFFHCLETLLRLLSPFMPFTSEYLYENLPAFEGFNKCTSITIANFPNPSDWSEFRNVELERQFKKISKLLSVLRNAKSVFHLKNEQPNVFVQCPDDVAEVLFGNSTRKFSKLGRVANMSRVKSLDKLNVIQQVVEEDVTVFIQHNYKKSTLEKLLNIDVNKERDLKENFEKMSSFTKSSDWETLQRGKKLKHMKEMKKLESQLNEMKNLRYAIENCES